MDIKNLREFKHYILTVLIEQNAEPDNDPAGRSLLAKVRDRAPNNKIPENFPDIYEKIIQAFNRMEGDDAIGFLYGLLKLIESKLK